VYNPSTQALYLHSFFGIKQFNRAFRFNPTKFYRALMYFTNINEFSFNYQIRFGRINSLERENYADFFNPRDIALWKEFPEKYLAFERNQCGFYNFTPFFSLTKKINGNFTRIDEDDLMDLEEELNQSGEKQ